MSAPRVLVSGVVLGQPMGGVHRHNRELLPRLARLLEAEGGGLAVLEGRVPINFPLPANVRRIPSDVPAGPPFARALREGRALRRAIEDASARGEPFDLVHTAHLPAPRDLLVPYTLTVHDLRSLDPRLTPRVMRIVARRVLGRAVRGARRVFTVSETVRAEVSRRFGIAAKSITVVPNAADHLPVLPRQASRDAPILHVGHIEPRKNLKLLLHALALDPQLPGLWLVGAAKGNDDERLRALARKLGIADRVRFLGAVPDEELPRLYATAGCMALPSLLEGFGIPALEARRAGLPLAVSSAGALPETAGPTAHVFAPDDAAECARALARALEEERATEPDEQTSWPSWDASATCWAEGLTLAASSSLPPV